MIRRHLEPAWLRPGKWIGTGAGIAGAVLIALNLGFAAYGFGLFLISSLLWTAVGWVHREPSLTVLQSAFTVINVIGIYRWAVA